MVDRSGQRSHGETGRESGAGRPAATGRGAVARLRHQFRAQEFGKDADRARAPAIENETAFSSSPATWRRAGSNSFSFSAAIPFTTRPARLTIDPETKQQLDWPDLQKKVPDVVRLGYYEDATSSASQWHVPMAHYLESWGDALTADGAYLAMQPMILPLFGGLSEIEMMNLLLGGPKLEGPELVRETFRAKRRTGRLRGGLVEILARRIRFAHSIARQTADVQRQYGRRNRAYALGAHAAADTAIARDRSRRQLRDR